jgi:hypothetical protein
MYFGMAQPISQTEIDEQINTLIGQYNEALTYVGIYGSGQDWSQTTRRLVNYNVDNQVSTYYEQDYLNGKWDNYIKYEYSYGSKAKVSSVAVYNWFNDDWSLYSNKIYNYGAQSLLTEYITQKLKNGTITNDKRLQIEYDANGQVIEYIQQIWGESEWFNVQRYVYQYDDKKELLSASLHIWNDYVWVKNRLEIYKYDQSGNVEEKETSIWKNDSWQYQAKEVNEYDKWKRKTGVRTYLWNDYDWLNDYRHIITYNTQNHVEKYRVMKWSTEQLCFSDYSNTEYKYNSSSNITETLFQLAQNGTLANLFNTKLNYDEDENFTRFEKYIWQADNWVNNIKFQYNYGFVSVEELTPKPNISSISFPNPFAESTTINFKVDKQSPVTLKVFDFKGIEVAVLESNTLDAGDYNYPFSANDLRSGTYFYQLTVGNNIVYKPITIID